MKNGSGMDERLQRIQRRLRAVIGAPQAEVVLAVVLAWAGRGPAGDFRRKVEGRPDQPARYAAALRCDQNIAQRCALIGLFAAKSAVADFFEQDWLLRHASQRIQALLELLRR